MATADKSAARSSPTTLHSPLRYQIEDTRYQIHNTSHKIHKTTIDTEIDKVLAVRTATASSG